ncbi:hypothetical protein FR483_n069L [Paramecium bursaria Chlorella virus FR483]|uniref:Uncharacterized protein n069L n=1 Tax=Paramecium bursaria Chlorella virus FR483 TaxID=399781 RepID=A7J6C3_PBCVF|nr:hypothetical protein FR483_n069L [Paramecium bursaria Chlorella virus FR483]ABT15354.1 hypothetical protein FR483_n069L [Paramecium bursaria Chlorella virus FR483]
MTSLDRLPVKTLVKNAPLPDKFPETLPTTVTCPFTVAGPLSLRISVDTFDATTLDPMTFPTMFIFARSGRSAFTPVKNAPLPNK